MKKTLQATLTLVLLNTFLMTQKIMSAPGEKGLLPEVQLNSDNEDQNNEKAFKSEVLITKTENKAIESLKKIIQRKKGQPDEADLNYRLAELYMRRAKSGRFFDLNVSASQKLNKLGVQNQKSIEALNSAIEIYNKIERQFPNYKNLDAVLFNNALAHAQTQKIETAQKLYNKLIAQYPQSILIPDALLEVGELYYNQQKFTIALEKFKQIEKFKNSKAYPYGLYKSAWCLYNLKNTDEGVQKLIQVVKLNPADSADEKKYNLRKEALRDLTLFVGETTPADQVYSFFKKICTENELGEVITNLANLYESHSRYKDISVFANEYISEYPNNEYSSKIYTQLIGAEETLKNRPQVISHLKKFGQHCQTVSQDALKVCYDEFRKVNLDISKKWWDIWLKNKKHTEFSDLTEQAFEILLQNEDPKNPDSVSRYAYAELLFQQEKYKLAEDNYINVAEHKNLDKTRAHDALYGALFSIEKQLEKVSSKLSTSNSASDEQNMEYNLLIERQKSLANKYISDFPNGEHVANLKYKLGFIAYKQNDYDLALTILNPFLGSQKKNELNIKAEDIVLDIYNIKKDFKKIISVSQQIEKTTPDEQRKKNLLKINEQAQYAQLQKDVENIQTLDKINLLTEFAAKHKSTQLGQDSLWKAVSLAYSQGHDVVAADLSVLYSERYPNDNKSTDAIKDAVKSYIEAGHLQKAIASVRTLARLEPEKAQQHLETSCDLLRINSQLPEARGCYKGLFTKADRAQKSLLLTKMMKSFGDSKNTVELESIENQIISENIEPYATQILISKAKDHLENKKYSEAFNLASKINARSVPADLRAEARLIHAAILEKEFISQSVKAQESKFSMVLAIKTEKFDKAFTAYSSTLKMSKTEKIQAEALKGLDRLYTHFADALITMPIPQSLSSDEREALKSELVKIAVPFQEKRKDNLVKLRQISKLSTNNSEEISWMDYSIEKTIEPRIYFLPAEKITHLLPTQLNAYKGSPSRLPSSSKKCDVSDLSASSIGGCIQAKKYKEAEKIAQQLTLTKEQRPMGLYYLSVIADQLNEYDKALWMIEKSLELDPTISLFNFQKAKVLYSVEDINTALPYFEKALDIKKLSQEITVMNALKSFSDRDFITASEEFSQLSTEELYNYNVAVLYVESTLMTGETNKASTLADRFISARPKNVDMYIQQARIFEEFAFKKDQAVQSYQKALAASNLPEQKNWLKKKIEYLKTTKASQISMDTGG